MRSTAEFLERVDFAAVGNTSVEELGHQFGHQSFATAINSSYLNAAMAFSPQVDIDMIIDAKRHVSGRSLRY